MNKLLIIVSLLILSACNSKNDNHTILLRTNGYVETQPDEAQITLQLECLDKNIDNARKCLLDKTSQLTTELLNSGIQKPDILTTAVNLNKDYIWINNSNIFNGFRASTSMNVKIRDLELLDGLYGKLLNNEQLTIGSLTYHHSKMDSLNGIAYLKALESAGYIADKILSQMPEENKVITKISNVEIPFGDIPSERKSLRLEASQAGDQSMMTVNIGNIRIEKQLYVEFRVY